VSEQLPDRENIIVLAENLLSGFPLNQWHKDAAAQIKLQQNEGRIAIACSGGADSTFAVLLVYAALPQLRDSMILIHFNHKVRAGSDQDEQFVKSLAENLGLPCITERGSSINGRDEGTLRGQRLKFFFKEAKIRKIDLLVQGHNQDDVAETMLWRLSRGSSPDGLAAPRAFSPHPGLSIIRPFLTVSRAEIRNKLKEVGMSWQEDESNVSPAYLRNRIRKNSLQALKEDVDRDVLRGMLRSRDLLEEQSHAINGLAAEASKDCITNGRVSILKLKKFPDAIRRILINNWLQSNPEIEKVSFSQTQILLDCLNAGSQEELSLSPQIRVKIDFDHLLIEKTCHPQEGWLPCSLPMGHDLHLPGGQVLRASMIKATPPLLNRVLSGRVDPRREAFCFFAPNQEASLLVRTRQPGDLFKPMGAPGSKKVSGWMIDRKYNSAKRETIPMIIDRLSENIIWIPGFAPAESHRLDQSNITVIHLTYDRAPT